MITFDFDLIPQNFDSDLILHQNHAFYKISILLQNNKWRIESKGPDKGFGHFDLDMF